MSWKTTAYFDGERERKHPEVQKDHAVQVAEKFVREEVQKDGRIRRWGYVEELGKYVRVVIESDGRTIHNASSTVDSDPSTMHITYYSETDTLSLDFRKVQGPVAETIDGPDEDILLDFDAEGKLVSVLIEHASRRTDLEHLRQQPQFETAGEKVGKTG